LGGPIRSQLMPLAGKGRWLKTSTLPLTLDQPWPRSRADTITVHAGFDVAGTWLTRPPTVGIESDNAPETSQVLGQLRHRDRQGRQQFHPFGPR